VVMPNAAKQVYPHLPSGARPEVQQRTPSLAEAMYGRPPPTNPYRESLLRGLKELNATIDTRLAREGKR